MSPDVYSQSDPACLSLPDVRQGRLNHTFSSADHMPPKLQRRRMAADGRRIKTGKIDPVHGKMINDAFENRAGSDYGVFVEFSMKDLSKKLTS